MLASVEIIENPKESINRAYDISNSARDELLLVFPTTNSFRRNVCIGISMQILKDDTKNMSMKQHDYQYTLIINQLFRHIR
jgi:hypothetical protein